jgi:hypothetical protein
MSIDVGDDVPHDIAGLSSFVFGPAETDVPTSRLLAAIATKATKAIMLLHFVSEDFLEFIVHFSLFAGLSQRLL